MISVTGCSSKDTPLTASDYEDSDFDNSSDIILTTQHQVYGNDIERITCFLQNNTDKEYMYGEPYAIERFINGIWYQIPFPENSGWNALGYILLPKSTATIYVSLSYLDYKFKDGTYRIVKNIGDKNYCATFELGESNITKATPFGFKDLKKLEKNYSKEKAIKDGVVVITYEGIENSKEIGEFVENVSRNIETMLRIIQYTIEGDPIITDITYHVDRDNYYTLSIDNSRDHFAGKGKGISEIIYSYMVTDGTRLYLSNYAKWDKENDKKNICLVDALENEEWISMVPIVEKMTENRLLSNITIYKEFSSDHTKIILLAEDPLEFGYNNDNGLSEMRRIYNKMGIAVKIKEALWADTNTILLVCDTNSDMKYYEFFDIQSGKLRSYKASTQDYYIDDGEIIIPD
jgi:hypothetical protein